MCVGCIKLNFIVLQCLIVGNGSVSVSVSESDWTVSVGNSDWGMDSLGDDWGSDGLGNNSWGRSVDNSVESVDGVSGVGDGTDGTIGFNKRVLSLNNISVAGFSGGLGVSGQTISNGVSVVVLWMRIVWLWGNSDGLGDWGSIGEWGSDLGDGWTSISKRSSSISDSTITGISNGWANNASGGSGDDSGENGDLVHDEGDFCLFYN